jgi:hypothetical protein
VKRELNEILLSKAILENDLIEVPTKADTRDTNQLKELQLHI